MHERSILGWLVVGLVAGLLGKAIMPGRDPGGVIVTILIGIAGALLAGFVARAMGWRAAGWEQYAAATLGAVAFLVLYRLVMVRRAR